MSAIAFGRFVLVPTQQLLLESGQPVQLGARALDILTALVERAGDLVTKEELVARAWPDTVVHDGNLKVHIAAIRRVLADGQNDLRYVVNVSGRGYRFVAPVTAHQSASLSRVFGRADVIGAIATLLAERRFVTIVGPGGIGKTTVARAIAAADDDAVFADLAPLSDPLLLPSSVAALLGVLVNSENPLPQLLQFSKNKKLLIVLDSCEHVLEAVASLAESLCAAAPGLRLLATSREPLRAAGEVVRRLPPLDVPPESEALNAREAEAFSAVALFVERARAGSGAFVLRDADVPHVAEICRRLDGNALAIELAAGRVDAFGIGGVASRLGDRFNLLEGGRRTALPRHQGVRATLDWSYGLLSEDERAVLRRLSVFVGPFTLDAAEAVAADETHSVAIAYYVANLVAKSLVSVDTSGKDTRYRLLDTTSAYARELLGQSNEHRTYAARHARYFHQLLARTTQDGRQIDNVRRALDWSFSELGDGTLGIELTIAAVPLWLNLSLMDECQQRVRNALRQNEQAPVRDMQLYSALGVTLYSMGSRAESKAAWLETLSRAERLDNSDFRLRALWGLWTVCITGNEHTSGLALAHRFSSAAEEASDGHALLVSERLIGTSHHFLGHQVEARAHLEGMLARYTVAIGKTDVVRFQFDQTSATRSYLSRVLWLQGFPDQAAIASERALSEAQQIDHSQSICYCVASSGCPIAFLNGDLVTAERNVDLLVEHSEKCRLALWQTMGRGFKGILLLERGDSADGVKLLRQAIEELRATGFIVYRTVFLGELAKGLHRSGKAKLGLEAADDALALAARAHEHWYAPELLRIQAELLMLEGACGASERAKACLDQSLDLARRQDARSWQLRAAMSLARFGCAGEPLREAFSGFREGFDTADLRAARRLLDVPR